MNKINDMFNKIYKSVIILLDKIFESKIFKYLSVYVIGLLMFYVLSSTINRIILKYFVIDEKLLLQIPKFIFIILFVTTLIYVFYNIILKKYQLSNFLIHFLVVLSLNFIMLRWLVDKNGWSFIQYSSKVLYFDFLGIIFITSIIFIVINRLTKQKKIKSSNPFVSDDPVLLHEDDKLNYKERASNIVEYLERSNFENSFTIGIVGPWGNGKSSLISLIEKEMQDKQVENIIQLKFLPYLNHSENDIISDFFKQLSAEISKYSGRLSNQFLNYSDKLLKLYKNKSVADFFKSNSSLFSESSSYDIYRNINDTLKLLNKKYIVFIDDLDRLSNSEVLQVLKLVRNTANFKNFIFLIALDKDYMLETLLAKNDIADHTFVDKFFQLEVYLPEIDKSKLKTDFIDLINNTGLSAKNEFIRKVETCIYRGDNLFDDYISNYRSVKRLINQLVFDFNSLPDELDTNDFLNFTYLKMTFPSAIKFLNNNWSTVIPYNTETNLCELKEASNDKEDDYKVIRKSRIYYANQILNVDYKKYEISKGITDDVEVGESSNLSKRQNLLLIKTLIVLFGKENIAESHTSIKFENNLRKLLQQKIQEKDLSEVQFKSIFNFDKEFENLNKILSDGHRNNILNRLAYFNSVDKEETQKAIIVLLYIFNDALADGGYATSVWNILSSFISRQLKLKKGDKDFWNEKDKQQVWKYIIKEFVDNERFKLESKIKFLALISESRIKLDFSDWGTTEDKLKEKSLSLYKKLLESKQDNLWDIYDYSFYHAYHDVRKFHLADVINPITIKFWTNNNITLLCAQMIKNEDWTTKMVKTSDFTAELFGSKKEYKIFVNDILSKALTPELEEYCEFLEIESYTNFSRYIRFEFQKFNFIKQKLQRVKEINKLENDKFQNVVEIILKSDGKELYEITDTNMNVNKLSGFIEATGFVVDENYYTFIRLQTGNYHKVVPEIFQHYQNMLKSRNFETTISLDEKTLKVSGTDKSIKIISIQPKSYNSEF